MSVAMLDITNNDTVSWLSERLDILTNSLSSYDTSRDGQNSGLPDVAFFVDSGSFENLPAYFQVIATLMNASLFVKLYYLSENEDNIFNNFLSIF